MSERDSYPAGVPCWVTNLQHDVPAARAFYEGLFGWEMESGPADVAPYALGRLRGRDVAAIGTMPGSDAPPGVGDRGAHRRPRSHGRRRPGGRW